MIYASSSLMSSSLLMGVISCCCCCCCCCLPGEYHCSMSSMVCGSGRCSVSGSNRVSRPATVDRPPNNSPGNHGNSLAYTQHPYATHSGSCVSLCSLCNHFFIFWGGNICKNIIIFLRHTRARYLGMCDLKLT